MKRIAGQSWALPGAVFAGAFILYWLTAARSPGWVDANLILSLVRNLELGVWVNIHNLFNLLGYVWLGLFSRADPHFALTMLCSLLGSLSVLFMYLAGCEACGNATAAAIASSALTLSLSLWWHSTTIEVYTLNTALISVFLYLIFRSFRTEKPSLLYLAFFLGGLGISNHVLMGLYIFAFFAVLLPYSVRKFGLGGAQVAGLVLFYLAGTGFYAVLFVQQWRAFFFQMSGAGDEAGSGFLLLLRSLGGTFKYAMGGGFLKSMFPRGLPLKQKLFWRGNYLLLVVLNYPSAAIVFIFSGFPRLWKRSGFRGAVLFLLVGLAAQIVWSANYLIWDMYAFALPVYLMLAIPLTFGIDGFLAGGGLQKGRWLVLLTFLIPVILYPSFSRWPNRESTFDRYIALYPEAERTGGIWDPAEYIFNPIKRNYRGAEIFVEALLKSLPENAYYWDDESKALYPLKFYYQEIKARRLDINVYSVFGLLMDEERARRHADQMLAQLRRSERVFVSALVEPEREVLNQLYLMLSPEDSIEEIRSKDAEQLQRTFPGYSILEFPLVSDGSLKVFELKRRR